MDDDCGVIVVIVGLAILVGGFLLFSHLTEPKYKSLTPEIQATITALKAIPTVAPTAEPTPYPTYASPMQEATEVEY